MNICVGASSRLAQLRHGWYICAWLGCGLEMKIIWTSVHVLWGRFQAQSACQRSFYILKCFNLLRDKKKTTSELIEKRWKDKAARPFYTACRRSAPWPLPSSFDPFPFFCLLAVIAFTAHLQGHWLHLPSYRKTCCISACRALLLTLARRRQAWVALI